VEQYAQRFTQNDFDFSIFVESFIRQANHPGEATDGKGLLDCAGFEVAERSSRSREVVVEYPDYASALACYHSPEYQTNKKIRHGHLVADFVIVDG
jgi:uncharacterized protein (DUF1330 family)